MTGLPVTADNVVVILVPHIFANQFNAEDEVYNIDLIDFGNAFVFRDGKAIPAYWNWTAIDQPLLFTDLTGNPIYLRPWPDLPSGDGGYIHLFTRRHRLALYIYHSLVRCSFSRKPFCMDNGLKYLHPLCVGVPYDL